MKVSRETPARNPAGLIEGRDRSALNAVFAIDAISAELRAIAGHDEYVEWWNQRPDGVPSRIDSESERNPFISIETQLEKLSKLPQNSRYRRHAQGTLAAAIVTAASSSVLGESVAKRIEDVARQYNLLVQDLPFGARAPLRGISPDEAYRVAAFQGSPCRTRNLECQTKLTSLARTTVTLSFEVNRPIAELVRVFDPKLWDVGASENFEQADYIPEAERATRAPGTPGPAPLPNLPDEAVESAGAGTSWDGYLYENAVIAVSDLSLVDFKNILKISYQVDPADEPTWINLNYSLSESLSLDIAQSGPLLGGIDCDSGIVRVTLADDGWAVVKATKTVRITAPKNRRDAFNFNLAGAMSFWLKNLVVLGICDEASGSSTTTAGTDPMAKSNSGIDRAERAKLNFSNLKDRQIALLDGMKQHVEDINGVVNDALSEDYTAQKWIRDVTALWINGAAIVPNALFASTVVVPDEDEEDT